MEALPKDLMKDWFTAREALGVLRVKPQSLYAYVSRNVIRAMPHPADPRRSLYSRHDVEAAAGRRRKPRRRAEIAAGTITWGEPVLESGISAVVDGELLFSGKPAHVLADHMTLEEVACCHWRVDALAERQASTVIADDTRAKVRAFQYLAAEAGVGLASYGRAKAALLVEASELLSGFADALIGARYEGAIHERVQAAWKLDADAADLVRRALVLVSDHELNASTFAVRVAVSTGAPLSAATLAGFAALTGPLHGEASARALVFLRDIISSGDLSLAWDRHADARGYMPSFGHLLYPEGDPRARNLLKHAELDSDIDRAIKQVTRRTGHGPNIDAGLGAVALDLSLPDEAPFILFAMGRMAGWLGHALEQIEYGDLIRPRARYAARA